MRERILTWEKNIGTVSKTAGKYPQESYAAVVCAIKSEWIFIQRVTWDTEDTFSGVDKMIRETFLPRLFFGNMKTIYPIVGALSKILVNKSVLGSPEPSDVRTGEIIKLLAGERGTVSDRDGRRSIFQCPPPTESK